MLPHPWSKLRVNLPATRATHHLSQHSICDTTHYIFKAVAHDVAQIVSHNIFGKHGTKNQEKIRNGQLPTSRSSGSEPTVQRFIRRDMRRSLVFPTFPLICANISTANQDNGLNGVQKMCIMCLAEVAVVIVWPDDMGVRYRESCILPIVSLRDVKKTSARRHGTICSVLILG